MINIPIKMHWLSDWNGFEVGYPESEFIGLYKTYIANGDEVYMYIDLETNQIMEYWKEEPDE